MMNVLLYCKPTLEGRAFHNSAHWTWLARKIARPFIDAGHKVSVCLNSHQLERWASLDHGLLNEIHEQIIVDFASDITPGRFTADHYLAGSGPDTDISKPLKHLKEAVGERRFDCIISICDRGVLPRAAFPDAMHFSFVESPFTRSPYPRMWALDASGIDRSDVFHTGVADGLLSSITENELNGARRFAKTMSDRLRKRQLSELSSGRLKSNNVLVALQKEGVSALDTYTPYRSQLDFLLDVLETVPKDTGVVVTEHPQYPVIEKSAFLYLRRSYPNLLFYPKWMAIEGISQNLLSLVDAAVVQTSTVGIQASLIFGKPTVCVAPESRVGPFVPCGDISALSQIDTIPTLDDDRRFRLLAFQLFRYGYPDESSFDTTRMVDAIAKAVERKNPLAIYEEDFALRSEVLDRAVAGQADAVVRSRPFDKLIHLPGAPVALIETFDVYAAKVSAEREREKAAAATKPKLDAPVKGPSTTAKKKNKKDTFKWKVLDALERALPPAIVKPSEKVLKRLGII